MKPLKSVKIEWSAKFSYCIGLIASDGNLSKDGRHITFVSKDLDLIILFCKCLDISPKISIKRSGSNHASFAYFVQFSDVNFYRFLLSIGLTHNKSKTIGVLKIPPEFIPDFLRGSFDGDGTFYSYYDKRWRSSFMYYLCFISASIKHLEWIRSMLNIELAITGHLSTYKKQRAIQLRYAKEESKKIIEFMYYRADIPKLERKSNKVYNALAIDKKNSARVL